jgi:RimJ/RimL family protein N-acetyltransferase
MNIVGKKITLRAVEERDLPTLHKWSNDPYTQDIMGDIHFPSSFEYHKEWFNRLKDDKLNQRFAIVTPEDSIIGLSTIINIDWKNNHAWHGIMLGPVDMRGKGYGIDTVMTTMKYAFDELHMERLDGSMISYNEVSIKFYCEKLGWKKEGIRRNYYFRRGQYWDQIVVGITKQDYQELIAANKYWDEKL